MRVNGIPAEISVIRSKRRTLAAEIRPDGTLLVRAPMRLPEREIIRFLTQKAQVISKHLLRQQLLQCPHRIHPPPQIPSRHQIRYRQPP